MPGSEGCGFPAKLQDLPIKSWEFSVYGSESKALEAAIQYLAVFDSHLKGLES